MNIIESLITYVWGKENKTIEKASPDGVCPVCWGYQEYDNVVRDIVIDKQIEVNSGREKYNFIQDFVVNHIDGITLKNIIHGTECPTCTTKQ